MIKGRVKEVREDGTAVIVAPIDLTRYARQSNRECYVEYIDGRPLSDKQRRMCYALIAEIADWSGDTREGMKTALKLDFWQANIEKIGDRIFSLSNAPMSLVKEFQTFLVNFIIEYDVPTKIPLFEYVDDVKNYVYMCLIHKKCAICGKRADLHHIDVIGMGNDRNEATHLGREAMSLCRVHHQEIHDIGYKEFMDRYHLDGGIEIDKTILKIYGLKK